MAATFQKELGAPGEALYQRAAAPLDTSTAWVRQSTEACEATRLRAERTETLLSQQVVCLDGKREGVRALVKVLGAADARGIQKSVEAVYALSSPTDCANLTALSGQPPRPADPGKRAQLEQLESEVMGVKGWLQWRLGLQEAGIRSLEQAMYDAAEARSDRIQALALSHHQADAAERWGRLGEAMVRRMGGHGDGGRPAGEPLESGDDEEAAAGGEKAVGAGTPPGGDPARGTPEAGAGAVHAGGSPAGHGGDPRGGDGTGIRTWRSFTMRWAVRWPRPTRSRGHWSTRGPRRCCAGRPP